MPSSGHTFDETSFRSLSDIEESSSDEDGVLQTPLTRRRALQKRPLPASPPRAYATVVASSPLSPFWALPIATTVQAGTTATTSVPHLPSNNKMEANSAAAAPCLVAPPTFPQRRLFFVPAGKKAPLSLAAFSKLVLTLDGRDKFTKLLQYTCRMLAWWWSSSSSSSSRHSVGTAAARMNALKASLATSRKAFRLGRSVQEMQKLSNLGLLEWLASYYLNVDNDQYAASRSLSATASLPFWKIAGQGTKMLGLLGFWTADNVAFLTHSGLFDNYSLDANDRMAARKDLASEASRLANRSYFFGAVAGLLYNWKCYREHVAQDQLEGNTEEEPAPEKQTKLRLALLKSVCDVLVFSNNAGVDFWQRFRGSKMHEGVHCLCGLISASSVLYSNYPKAS